MDFEDALRRHRQDNSAAQEDLESALTHFRQGAAAAQREFDSRTAELLTFLRKKNFRPITPTFTLKHSHKKMRPERNITLPSGFVLKQAVFSSTYSATMLLDTGCFYDGSGNYEQPQSIARTFKPFAPTEATTPSSHPYIRQNLLAYVFEYDTGNDVRIEQDFGYGDRKSLSMDLFFESLLLDVTKEA